MKELIKRVSQNAATFRAGTIGARIVAGVLFVVVVGAVLATPVAALAAAADSEMVAGGGSIDAGTCHESWIGHHGSRNLVDYTQVKWTANSCGYLIRERTECEVLITNAHYDTAPSGIVSAVGIKARTYCHNGWDSYRRGEYQWKRPGGQWSAWKTFWKNPWA